MEAVRCWISSLMVSSAWSGTEAVESRLLSLLEGAREATGQVVIIDVYRA